MKNNILKIVIIGLLFMALVLVRFFESYFYDPLQSYFTDDYLHTKLPEINTYKLYLHLFIRYAINSIISLLIIWIAFKNRSYISFSLVFFSVAFIVLILVFGVALHTHFENYYLFGFYIRRFLIQPIFVLLLLPAFYYQDRFSRFN